MEHTRQYPAADPGMPDKTKGAAGLIAERIGAVAASVVDSTARARRIAERAFGSVPEAVNDPRNDATPPSTGEVSAAHSAIDYLESRVRDLDAQLDRLANL